MNEYSTVCRAVCPVDHTIRDVYTMTLRTLKFIPVEDIVATIKEVESMQIYQEELTTRFSVVFDCECTLIGHHSGVKIVSTAGSVR